MEINADEDSSSIFRLFTTQNVSKENGIINKSTENGKILSSKPSNNNGFDDCSQLPDGLKNSIPANLIGRPLEDIDPFYNNKETFIVLNKNKQLYRFSSTNALWIFSPTNIVRSFLTRVLVHPLYTTFIVALILAFCIVDAGNFFDLRYFLVLFLIESIVKIITHGLLLSPFTYLRNGWNILDVVLNIILMSQKEPFYLAELRILTIIPYSLNLRKTIRLYWSSCKLLLDLILYVGVILSIISAFFLQVYIGTLTQSCVKNDTIGDYNNLNTLNDEVRLCGNSSGSQNCPDGYVCLQGSTKNPDFGYTNFDSIFGSYLSTFRLMTRDFWENLLQLVLATSGPWHIISFIGIIFIFSYQYLSLIWGQIAVSYNYVKLQRWERNLIAEDVETDDMTSQESNNEKNTGCWSKFQRFFFFIIYNPYVVLFVIICIVLNTLCMALDHHDMDGGLEVFLRFANYFFVLVFVFEAILKLLALGIVRYFKDEWNTFDFAVTVLGAVELCLEGVQGLSVFRSFRLLRPLRLGKIVPAFDLLLTRMQHLFSVVLGQTIIFFMAIYIFVMFGCKQFAQYYREFDYGAAGVPLWNFTDPIHSFMVVFRALCGEWIETMYLCLQVANSHVIVLIYYFLMVVVGSFQVMHIFTALLFTNDDSSAISKKPGQKSSKESAKPQQKFKLEPFLKDKLLEPSIKKIYDEYRPKKDMESTGQPPAYKMVTKAVAEDEINESINNTDTSIPIEPIAENLQVNTLKTNKNKYFQHCVTLSVLVSSFTLAAGYGIHADSYPILHKISIYCDIIFIGLLSIELMTKLISRGWKNCITDIWYWVDLFNIIIAVIDTFFTTSVEVLTALRPLSLVSRCYGLNVIANTIFKQMWFLSNTILVCLAFWLIFAIMGVQLFAGKFYSCQDDNGSIIKEDLNKTSCFENNYTWTNSFMNFDNVIHSYYSLLEISTFKGWISIISDAVDSTELNNQPKKEENIYMVLYFVIFIVCGVFLSINVLVAILVQHMLHFGSLSELFNRRKSNSEQSTNTLNVDETADSNASNSKLVNFVRSHVFEKIALASYLVYIIVLMCDYYGASAEIIAALDHVHLVLYVLLLIEVGLRCFAYRKEFFISSWNRFDIIVVIFLILHVFTSDLIDKYFISVFILRIVRIFRFIGIIASLSTTLQCSGKVITKTWKTVATLFLFLLLIIFVYALIGMVLFKDVPLKFSSVDIINFNTFGQSVTLLIQISTGAGWDGVLQQINERKEGLAGISAAYMISFLYISFTILLNVIILIAFEFYKEVTAIDDERQQLQPDDLNDFNEKWKRFAQNDQTYVPQERLSDFFKSLDETSSLRPSEYTEKEIQLLGIQTTKDNNYSRSALLIALNRIRLSKLEHQ